MAVGDGSVGAHFYEEMGDEEGEDGVRMGDGQVEWRDAIGFWFGAGVDSVGAVGLFEEDESHSREVVRPGQVMQEGVPVVGVDFV